MSRFDNIRSAFEKAREIWDDRDIHIPAFKAGIKSLPSKFRAASSQQKRAVVIIILVIAALQALLLISL